MSAGARFRVALKHLLDQHQQAEGISADQYRSQPCYHPMAEGKFLLALSQAKRCGMLGAARVRRAAVRAQKRLAAANLSKDREQACWGLGFAYKEAPEDEPFLITTAIIAMGLLELEDQADQKLLSGAIRWLDSIPWRSDVTWNGQTLHLPNFSPHMPLVVTNAIAYWAAAMEKASRRMDLQSAPLIAPTAEWILSRYVEPVGWPYGAGNDRVDLLHQCYILNSLMDLLPSWRLHEITLRVINSFQGAGMLLDKIDLVDEPTAVDQCRRSARSSMLPAGRQWMVRYHEEARDWTYGELLVLLGRLACGGKYRHYWRVNAVRLARLCMQRIPDLPEQSDAEQPDTEQIRSAAPERRPLFLRDTMHLAHGLSWVLTAMRDANRRNEKADEEPSTAPAAAANEPPQVI